MARPSRQAKEAIDSNESLDLEAIFGKETGESRGGELFLSATDETIAMLNSVFMDDGGGWDSSIAWNFLTFG